MKAHQAYVDLHARRHLPLKRLWPVWIRVCVAQALGLAFGDAHILRNTGGRVTDDIICSLLISEQQLGTRELVVLHHTDCGAQTFMNEVFQQELQERLGVAH